MTRYNLRVPLVSRVVLPLDGSPQANAVLPLVVGLAPSLGSSVLLLRCVSDAGEEDAARRHLAGVAHELTRNDLDVTSRVVVGHPPREIAARVQASDLVALGLRARPEPGSVLQALLHTPAPLLLRVAGGRRVMRPKVIGSAGAGSTAAWAAALADLLHARHVTVSLEEWDGAPGEDRVDLLVVGRDEAVALILRYRCDIPLLTLFS